jgi:acetylornithine/N-succinyldiaminopimelate aminotransferase
MACRLGCEFLSVMQEEGILENVTSAGGRMGERLHVLADRFEEVSEVRGAGLMWGVELSVPARPLVEEGLRRGVLFNLVQGNVLRFLPPLVVSRTQVDQAIDVLEAIMDERFTQRAARCPAVEEPVESIA